MRFQSSGSVHKSSPNESCVFILNNKQNIVIRLCWKTNYTNCSFHELLVKFNYTILSYLLRLKTILTTKRTELFWGSCYIIHIIPILQVQKVYKYPMIHVTKPSEPNSTRNKL